MSEPPLHEMGPFDPPKPVYVRVPAQGRQKQDMAVWGLLHRWRRESEWGIPSWTAEVSLSPEPDAPRKWVTASSVRQRYPGDP